MTLNDLLDNWDSTSREIKVLALNRVIAESLAHFEKGEDDLLVSILDLVCKDFEQYDYFGTEGLNING